MPLIPIRGSSIGTAYVRILADGEGLPDSIRDEFDGADGAVDEAGQRHASGYKDAWESEMERSPRLGRVLGSALARDDFAKQFFDSPKWATMRRQFETQWASVGATSADQLRDKFIQQGSLRGIEAELDNVVERINRNIDDQLEADSKTKASMLDFEAEFRRTMEQTSEVSARASRERSAALDDFQENLRRTSLATARFGDSYRRYVTDEVERSSIIIERHRNVFNRFGDSIDDIAVRTGRLFGRGSRNNALNFLGGLAGGMVRLMSVIPRIAGGVLDLARNFGTLFSTARQTQGVLGSLVTAFGGLAASGLAGLPVLIAGLAAAMGVMVVIAGPLASLIMGVVGAIIALSGALAFAVVGALAPFVGLIAPLAAGIATLVIGFKNLKGRGDELRAALGPVSDLFDGIGDKVGNIFLDGLTDGFKGLGDSLRPVRGLLIETAEALADSIGIFTKGFDSPVFANFIDAMTRFIPGAIRSLSDTMAQAFSGFGGILIGLIPSTNRFLDWINELTERFSAWANSVEGQSQIRDFLDDAAESARKVGDAIGAISGLIGELFSSGRGTGDSLFQSLTDNVREFTDYLRANPDVLSDFFDNAQEVARDIGGVVIKVGELVGALDSASSRKTLGAIFTGISLAIDGIRVAFALLPLNLITRGVQGLVDLFGVAKDAFADADFSIPVPDLSGFRGLGSRVLAVIGKVDLSSIFQNLPVVRLISPFVGLANRIFSRIGKVDLGKIFNLPNVVTLLISPFSGLAGRIFSRLGRVDVGKIFNLPNIVTLLISPFSGLAKRIFGVLGKVDVGKIFNLPNIFTLLISPFSGLAKRIFNVIGKVDLGKIFNLPSLDSIAEHFRGLGGKILSAIGNIVISPSINMPDIPNINLGNPFSARGGIFSGAQGRIIGEEGPEAVVPLNRPLSQVDPAVRELSAIAQGLSTHSRSSGTQQKTIDASGWTIVSNAEDPRAVARETFNALVAQAI